jgi:gamma-glutamyltranspeptidase / glutathione hydrolase
MRDFHQPGRSLVYATGGMAATSHPLASRIAVDALMRGGNAVDAALAAAFALALCEPHMCGLGGDAFALVRPPGSDRIHGLNGSGRSPAAYDPEPVRAAGHARIPTTDIAAVTLPGAVDAFVRLSERWGNLPLAEVIAPAIGYAEDGVPVAPRAHADWRIGPDYLQGAARRHYLPDGAIPAEGAIFRAPGQAEVLRRIARQGRAGFYEGEVADDLVTSLRALGGAHTFDDFAAVAADEVDPITGSYRRAELVELPPNGQGAAALLLARMLERFDLASLDPLGPERTHIETEATKLAYDARNRFVAEESPQLERMLSDATAARLADLIAPDRVLPDPHAASEAVHRDTVYLTVVDRDRMAVSLIYSLFHAFGTGLASDRFGILFQNRGSGFSLERGHPNEAAPNKRPLHTIIPAMLRHDGDLMPFGVMGGVYQAAGHARFVSNLVDYGMDPQTATDLPRSFPEDGVLYLERGYPEATAEKLASLGHRVERRPSPLGGAQAIVIDEARGVLIGASDHRKDGCALGY